MLAVKPPGIVSLLLWCICSQVLTPVFLAFVPSAEQKRSVTFTEAQPEAPPACAVEPAQQLGCSLQAPGQQEPPSKPVLTSSPAIVVADLHSQVMALLGL